LRTLPKCLIVSYNGSISLLLYSSLLDLGRYFNFLIFLQSVGLLGRGINRSQGRFLHTEQHKHSEYTHTHTHTHISMSSVGFEPMILVLERAKTVHALDRAATVTGTIMGRPAQKHKLQLFKQKPKLIRNYL
jgi:hypothetical protein